MRLPLTGVFPPTCYRSQSDIYKVVNSRNFPCRICLHFSFQIAQKMIQQQFGDDLRRKIKDNGTYKDVSFYAPSYSDADYGTTHLAVLAKNRDAVSVTSTINYRFVSKRQWVWRKRLS